MQRLLRNAHLLLNAVVTSESKLLVASIPLPGSDTRARFAFASKLVVSQVILHTNKKPTMAQKTMNRWQCKHSGANSASANQDNARWI